MAKFKNQAATRTTISRIGGSAIILGIILIGVFSTQKNADTQALEETITAPVEAPAQTQNTSIQESEEVQGDQAFLANTETKSAETAPSENVAEDFSQNTRVAKAAAPMKTSSAVAYSSMKASIEGNNGKVRFQTSFQRHIKSFEIQRSIDDDTYETIGSIEGEGSGEYKEEKLYEFLDKTLAHVQMPRVYYRIKQTGFDGLTDYSDVIEYEFGLDLGLYARIDQSADGKIKIVYAADKSGPISLRFLNAAGEIVQKKRLEADFDPKSLSIAANDWKAGKYYLQLQDESTSIMEQFYYEK